MEFFLYDEPHFLLKREVNEIGSYFSIIKTIAAGNQKLSKIAATLELKQTGLTKYLKTLINLDILEREVPITEESPETSKKGLYKIKDNFIVSWFRFIFPNINYIESGHAELVMKKICMSCMEKGYTYRTFYSIFGEWLYRRINNTCKYKRRLNFNVLKRYYKSGNVNINSWQMSKNVLCYWGKNRNWKI